jgi:hypothetical protein
MKVGKIHHRGTEGTENTQRKACSYSVPPPCPLCLCGESCFVRAQLQLNRDRGFRVEDSPARETSRGVSLSWSFSYRRAKWCVYK